MTATWRNYLCFSAFLVLFGAAIVVTVNSGPFPNMKGAWVGQAMR
jgi:hypothetical protein